MSEISRMDWPWRNAADSQESQAFDSCRQPFASRRLALLYRGASDSGPGKASVFSGSLQLSRASDPPAGAQFAGGLGPGGKVEGEAGREQARGDDAAAFQNQLALGAQEAHADF